MLRFNRGQKRVSANQESGVSRQGNAIDAVLRGSTENENRGDRLMWTVADTLLREIRASMGGMSSQLGGPSSVLTTPARFGNAEIDPVSDQLDATAAPNQKARCRLVVRSD